MWLGKQTKKDEQSEHLCVHHLVGYSDRWNTQNQGDSTRSFLTYCLFSSNCKVKSLLYQEDCSFLGEVFREVRGAHFVVDGEGCGGS